MPKRQRDPKAAHKSIRSIASLSLKLESTDKHNSNVDAEEFFATSEKWLNALIAFAKECGEHVKWEIVDLRKSSALIQVQPVKIKTRKPAPSIVIKWEKGLRRIQKTGQPTDDFTPESLSALQDFVFGIPKNTIVSVGNGKVSDRLPISALTQRRVEEAINRMPVEPRQEYVSIGSIRGRLAVLDSWDPEERSFRLQLPLSPAKPVKCTYSNASLVTELGEGFEGMVEITGQLRYKPDQAWPYAADVDQLGVLPRKAVISLQDLVGLIHLPDGQDSVSYIGSLRDAE